MRVWDANADLLLLKTHIPGRGASLDLSNDARRIAYAFADGNGNYVVRLAETADPNRHYLVCETGDELGALVALSPDGNTLIWGGTTAGKIHVFDIPSRKEKGVLQFGEEGRELTLKASFDLNGKLLALSHSSFVTIWDMDGLMRWRAIGQSKDSPCTATAVAISPDGRTLATGHENGDVLLWEVPAPSSPRDAATQTVGASQK